ncbi:hypothetical protein [Actinoplanes sp. DH11]|uniref:hypothetical protein n=1 Tax=Actinoplanes sp. DH11 TaxID=2857011 RepID=UPI001E2E43D8|nr:hypothetical protein [Actinoplanes sp. DH11]
MVALGPYSDRVQHERFVLETAGSVDWFSTVEVDEFRFDVESGLLRGVALRVPEHTVSAGRCAEGLTQVEELRGAPRLIDIANFQVPSTASRLFEQGALMCLTEGSDQGSKDPVWVNIAPGLSLLIVGGDYAGWRLKDAASALEDSDNHPPRAEIDDELVRGLEEYLELTSFPYSDRIFDADLGVREKLEGISQRLRVDVGENRRREILVAQIDRLIMDWY